MIGKPVSGDELAKVLDRQAEREKFVKQLLGELRALKPGECLLYETKSETLSWASLGLAHLMDGVKGLKMITEERLTYVYREK